VLVGAVLVGAVLVGAVLVGAVLVGAVLVGAALVGAVLVGAVLVGAIPVASPSGSGRVGWTWSGNAGSGQVCSLSSRTGSPSRMARLTAAMAPSAGQPRLSSPGMPALSVAVVITGSAPRTPATRAASAFAPMPWPPDRATA
jgi:hypothetical protein